MYYYELHYSQYKVQTITKYFATSLMSIGVSIFYSWMFVVVLQFDKLLSYSHDAQE